MTMAFVTFLLCLSPVAALQQAALRLRPSHGVVVRSPARHPLVLLQSPGDDLVEAIKRFEAQQQKDAVRQSTMASAAAAFATFAVAVGLSGEPQPQPAPTPPLAVTLHGSPSSTFGAQSSMSRKASEVLVASSPKYVLFSAMQLNCKIFDEIHQ